MGLVWKPAFGYTHFVVFVYLFIFFCFVLFLCFFVANFCLYAVDFLLKIISLENMYEWNKFEKLPW